MIKRIAAALCAVLLALTQVIILMPEKASAGGDNLVIRVQYAGEPAAKIREKATLTRGQLTGMSSTYCYSNVTSVGTVMVMKASGAKMTSVLDAAGVDINSVKLITFRTDDGYTRNFNRNQITGSGYYYPKLNLKEKKDTDPTEPTDPTQEEPSSETDKPTDTPTEPTKPTETPTKPTTKPTEAEPADEGGLFADYVYGAVEEVKYYERIGSSLKPLKGFDEGATMVPAILAVKFGESKIQGRKAENLDMSTSRTYRFCIGQTKLKVGKKTTSGDVTSMDSAHSIYGIDVTLEGSPVKGISLSVDDPEMIVGSQKTVKAVINGDELFSEYVDTDSLVWSSSNKAIATVDQNGVVTIKKKGKVTITAVAKDGTKGSITLGGKDGADQSGGSDDPGDSNDNNGGATGNGSTDKQVNAKDNDKTHPLKRVKVNTIRAKEIFLGEKIVEAQNTQEVARAEVQADAQALDEVESYDRKVAAGSAAAAICICGAGFAIRIRKFFREV